MDHIILLPVALPILAGIVLLLKKEYEKRKSLLLYVGIVLVVTGLLAFYGILTANKGVTLFYITETLPIYFKADMIGKFFASVVTVVWILAGFFSFEYMKHEKNEKRYFGFYLITFGVLLGLDFAGNLITMYLFYELMTLLSMPLVDRKSTRLNSSH